MHLGGPRSTLGPGGCCDSAVARTVARTDGPIRRGAHRDTQRAHTDGPIRRGAHRGAHRRANQTRRAPWRAPTDQSDVAHTVARTDGPIRRGAQQERTDGSIRRGAHRSAHRRANQTWRAPWRASTGQSDVVRTVTRNERAPTGQSDVARTDEWGCGAQRARTREFLFLWRRKQSCCFCEDENRVVVFLETRTDGRVEETVKRLMLIITCNDVDISLLCKSSIRRCLPK